MNIVASETGNAAAVHDALNEVISLHAILVSGAMGEMREGGFAESAIFEPPKIAELSPTR